jgi:hypothetical protein
MGYEGVSGGVQSAFCVRNGSGGAHKWTSVSPCYTAVFVVVYPLLMVGRRRLTPGLSQIGPRLTPS